MKQNRILEKVKTKKQQIRIRSSLNYFFFFCLAGGKHAGQTTNSCCCHLNDPYLLFDLVQRTIYKHAFLLSQYFGVRNGFAFFSDDRKLISQQIANTKHHLTKLFFHGYFIVSRVCFIIILSHVNVAWGFIVKIFISRLKQQKRERKKFHLQSQSMC